MELDNHSILPDSRLSSDHAPLLIEIPIGDEIIHSLRRIIPPRSKQEKGFIEDIISNLKSIDTSNIEDTTRLDHIVNQVGSIIKRMWYKNAKKSKFSKHSKQWWTDSCRIALNSYRTSRSRENWKTFKSTIKEAKQSFFDNKIQEITNKNHGSWELMNWVKRKKLLATEAIEYNNRPCLTPNSLWDALHNMFNMALHRQVDINILNEIDHKLSQVWMLFSRYEFESAIQKCSDNSAPGPDKMSWRHWKLIFKDSDCLSKIINIADACINLGHWPKYFKISTTVIIPKPNKPSYNNPKAFRPIVLLNTLRKLLEKVITERIQFTVVSNDFIYPSQLGGLKFKSTSDAGVALTHIIRSG